MVENKRKIPWPAIEYYKRDIIRFETTHSFVDGYSARANGFSIVVKARTCKQLRLETEEATNAYFSKEERPPIIELVLSEDDNPLSRFVDFIVHYWWQFILGLVIIPSFIPILWEPAATVLFGIIAIFAWGVLSLFARILLYVLYTPILEWKGVSTMGSVNYAITVDGKYEIDKITIRYSYQDHRSGSKIAWSDWSPDHSIPIQVKVSYLKWLPFVRMINRIDED